MGIDAINIILDESNPSDVRFIEIEDDSGKSINIGDRISDGKYTRLRISLLECNGETKWE